MFKRIASYCLLLVTILMATDAAEARAKNAKNKKKKRSHKIYKVSKHKRKSRHFARGNGPDLKSITTDSPYPYKEDSNNGVNPLENK